MKRDLIKRNLIKKKYMSPETTSIILPDSLLDGGYDLMQKHSTSSSSDIESKRGVIDVDVFEDSSCYSPFTPWSSD